MTDAAVPVDHVDKAGRGGRARRIGLAELQLAAGADIQAVAGERADLVSVAARVVLCIGHDAAVAGDIEQVVRVRRVA